MKLFVTTREKKMFISMLFLLLLTISLWYALSKKEQHVEELNSSPELKNLSAKTEQTKLKLGDIEEDKTESDKSEKTDERNRNQKNLEDNKEKNKEASSLSVVTIMVDVKGAVHQPNVYQLSTGTRVIDAIQQAGGLTEQAVTKYINLAQPLHDGMAVYIPTQAELNKGEVSTLNKTGSSAEGTQGNSPGVQSEIKGNGKVNINTASAPELEQLPGIGPSRAQTIIKHRNEKGSFKKREDIMKVSGIGSKMFDQIKDLIDI